MENIKINFSIERKEMTTKEYINFCKNIISKLKSHDDLFGDLNIIDVNNKSHYFFKEDLSDFDFETLFPIINEEDITYRNADVSNKSLTLYSKSWTGFSTKLFFGGQKDIDGVADIQLGISQGSYENRVASINIEYSKKLQDKLNIDYIVGLVEVINQNTNLIFANTITNKFFLEIRQKGKRSVGWVNFTRNKKIVSILDENDVYKVIQNGVIFSISENMPSNENKNLIEKAKKISDELE